MYCEETGAVNGAVDCSFLNFVQYYKYVFFMLKTVRYSCYFKGFLDKVFLPKFAYQEDRDGNWQGLLTNIKKATVVTTATYSKESLTTYGDVIQGVFMNSTLRSVGIPIEKMKWIYFSEVNITTDERKKEFLEQLPALI